MILIALSFSAYGTELKAKKINLSGLQDVALYCYEGREGKDEGACIKEIIFFEDYNTVFFNFHFKESYFSKLNFDYKDILRNGLYIFLLTLNEKASKFTGSTLELDRSYLGIYKQSNIVVGGDVDFKEAVYSGCYYYSESSNLIFYDNSDEVKDARILCENWLVNKRV
ncbi:hypothetical protein [Vibrio tetraodonis]|nr:hypothetical protein [Vibrio tetraodonis]